MPFSMTGYGRGSKNAPEYTVTIDLKSVNHRYLEVNFKIPKTYLFLEDKLRREISNRLSRGKFDVIVNIERFFPEDSIGVKVNRTVVSAYLKASTDLKDEFQLDGALDLLSILNLPDVIKPTQPEEDQEVIAGIACAALDEALNTLIIMRKTEGIKLQEDLEYKIAQLQKMKGQLTQCSATVVLNYKEKLLKRITELTDDVDIDPNRLAVEIAIFADKSDINEELVRIESHLQQFGSTLKLAEPIGRRLDFIIQELNREINTIGSKANDLQIAQIVIDFKAVLEKLREQVQNIE